MLRDMAGLLSGGPTHVCEPGLAHMTVLSSATTESLHSAHAAIGYRYGGFLVNRSLCSLVKTGGQRVAAPMRPGQLPAPRSIALQRGPKTPAL